MPEQWDVGGDDSKRPPILKRDSRCQDASGLAFIRQEHFADVLQITSQHPLAVIVPGDIDDMFKANPMAVRGRAQHVKFSIRDPATNRIEGRGDKMPMILYQLGAPDGPVISRGVISVDVQLRAPGLVDIQVSVSSCLTDPEVWTSLSQPWHSAA